MVCKGMKYDNNGGIITVNEGRLDKNIRAGNPAAPGYTSLPLLPLGSDGVRRAPPRRTHPDGKRIPDVARDVNVRVIGNGS